MNSFALSSLAFRFGSAGFVLAGFPLLAFPVNVSSICITSHPRSYKTPLWYDIADNWWVNCVVEENVWVKVCIILDKCISSHCLSLEVGGHLLQPCLQCAATSLPCSTEETHNQSTEGLDMSLFQGLQLFLSRVCSRLLGLSRVNLSSLQASPMAPSSCIWPWRWESR